MTFLVIQCVCNYQPVLIWPPHFGNLTLKCQHTITKAKVRSVHKAVVRTRRSWRGGWRQRGRKGRVVGPPDGMARVMNPWNQALAEITGTEIQMWGTSFGKECMTSFNNIFNEQERRAKKDSSFLPGTNWSWNSAFTMKLNRIRDLEEREKVIASPGWWETIQLWR